MNIIEQEIFTILAVALVVVLITIIQLQRNALRNIRRKNDLEFLTLAENIKTDNNLIKQKLAACYTQQEQPFIIYTSFFSQVLFGVILLVGFIWWTLFLNRDGFNGWAILTGILALLGAAFPFIAWHALNQRNEDYDRLINGLKNLKHSSPVATTAGITRENMTNIPQDSVLKRHYFQNLKANVEASMPPRPTDSTLRRHFDAMYEDEVNLRLAALSS